MQSLQCAASLFGFVPDGLGWLVPPPAEGADASFLTEEYQGPNIAVTLLEENKRETLVVLQFGPRDRTFSVWGIRLQPDCHAVAVGGKKVTEEIKRHDSSRAGCV